MALATLYHSKVTIAVGERSGGRRGLGLALSCDLRIAPTGRFGTA